ncbi:Response regulator receiver domain-containing protein [Burkholderia sp. OK233]|nr:Response regulator receiver domain-containing protein [Burkholderia sp. OK233]
MHTHPIVSIIDDDESVRIATSSLVRSLGWDVRLYASAEDFLDSGQISDVACIISDVQMPGMTGLEMQRRLLDGGIMLPIIFISAFASETVRRQALDSGAMCVLSKPVDGTAVSRCLERL